MAVQLSVSDEHRTPGSQHGEGIRHLQRIVRKVKHVLVVRHCIDGLQSPLRLRPTPSIVEKICRPVKTELIEPQIETSTPPKPSQSIVEQIQNTICRIAAWVGEEEPLDLPDQKPSTNFISEFLNAPLAKSALNIFEKILDDYIDRIRSWSGSCSFWLGWARKRSLSVDDPRAKAFLGDLHDSDQLDLLNGYLLAYTAEEYDQDIPPRKPPPLPPISELADRWSSFFGSGWFFEWPGGRRPLNSTWPWSGVRPALVVLWGVCWMFYDNASRTMGMLSTWQQQPAWPEQPASITLRPSYPARTMLSHQPSMFDASETPQGNREPMGQRHFVNNGLAGQQMGLYNIHTAGMNNQVFHQADFQGLNIFECKDPNNTNNGVQVSNFQSSQSYQPQPQGQSPDTFIQRFPDLSNYNFVNSTATPSPFVSPISGPSASIAAQPQVWRSTTQNSGGLSEPKANRSRVQQHHPSITNPPSNPPLNGPHTQYTGQMPSTMNAMPEQHFTYPALAEMMHDAPPYTLPEQREFHQLANERDYDHEHLQEGPPRYPSPPPGPSADPYQQLHTAHLVNELQAALEPPKSDSGGPESPGRSKPVPKPDRPITKDQHGRYVCDWTGCEENVKDFGRKCEWSKHMDKHDRPYKCPADGCEKLPGFTYSGGLLRHEREVHNKHGGPRKQLNCPHMNCKRHTGKGFSRQENLNEHLRRVHTDASALPPNGGMQGDETEEDALGVDIVGQKRKRTGRGAQGADEEVREELKRIKLENEELKRQSEEMMRQIHALQQQAGLMAQHQQEQQLQQQQQQQQQQQEAPRMPSASMI